MRELIGRRTEIAILRNILESKEAEFVAVYGRLEIGKKHFHY